MRIFTFDIETTPNAGWFWSLFPKVLGDHMITAPTRVLCWAGKFLGEKEVYFGQGTESLQQLADCLNSADAYITFNGDKFDVRHVRREMLELGIPPLRPAPNIDLYKVVKSQFNFPSNRLDYVAYRLLGIRKVDTGGFALWPACMEGDEKAWRKMKRYNVRDVRITERLYKHLRPWIVNHPYGGDVEIDDEDTDYVCSCGSHSVRRDRPRRTRCYAVRMLQCNSCGSWFEGRRRRVG